jgi:aminopeptidase N
VTSHELGHQWWGDNVTCKTWSDIWLNEGFATYAQWLWSESQGEGTAAEIAAYVYSEVHPAGDPFWQVLPGDPGAVRLFDDAVYDRGALTLQHLRELVGDDTFFAILRAWATAHRYGNGTTAEFRALAEQISGANLDAFFQTWLFTPGRPELGASALTAPAEPRSWPKIVAAREAAQR